MKVDTDNIEMHASNTGVVRNGVYEAVYLEPTVPVRRTLPRVPSTSGLAYVEKFSAERRRQDD